VKFLSFLHPFFSRNQVGLVASQGLFLLILLLLILSCGKKERSTIGNFIHNPARGKWDREGGWKVSFQYVLSIGVAEGDENQQFYKASDLTVDEEGNIYILDSGNNRVQVFDANGDFKFSFGKAGKGPGEFSSRLSAIKYLDDGFLWVVDYQYRRVNKFSKDGKFIDSFTTKEPFDDVIMDGRGNLVFSNFLLTEDHVPLHKYTAKGRLISSFGSIFDPGDNLIAQAKRFNMPYVLSYGLTNIEKDGQGNIYYSQRNPYLIAKYSPKGKLLLKFNRKTEFATLVPLRFEMRGKGLRVFMEGSFADISQIGVLRDSIIAVPVFSPERDRNFIDFYNTRGRLLSSVQLPIETFGPSTYISATVFDRYDNFYCLYGSHETYQRVVKYVIKFEQKRLKEPYGRPFD